MNKAGYKRLYNEKLQEIDRLHKDIKMLIGDNEIEKDVCTWKWKSVFNYWEYERKTFESHAGNYYG